jgi:hypothetical protein
MKNEIKINVSGENRHQCETRMEGQWIVFTCPVCDDYERRIHSVTKETRVKRNPDNPYNHGGSFIRPGFDAVDSCPN